MKNFLTQPLFILIITAITGLFVISLRRTAQKSLISQRNVEVLEQKIQDTSAQIQTEKNAVEYASSEFSKEKILRDELLLQQPGEYILQIPLEEKTTENSAKVAQQSPWEAWISLLWKP